MSGLRLGVLVSGSGSNLQSVIDATYAKTLKSEVVCVISNKEMAFGLERARKNHIPAYFINPKEEDYDQKVMEMLITHQVELVVLAGYLKIIPEALIDTFSGRVINIHPSLLPKYGGQGYYGIHVHRAVIEAGETKSGATVHYVDKGIDTGAILIQEAVVVEEEDIPESLKQKILLQIEHHLLVRAIKMIEEESCI